MRKWKVIIAFVLIFAILGAAYFLIEKAGTPKQAMPQPETPKLSVLSRDAAQVIQIEIRNGEGQYAFVRNAEGWLVKNEPDIELQSARVESLCVSAATLPAESLVARETEDLSAYGLTAPQAEVTLSFENGETVTLKIGDATPGNDGYYACVADSADVYLISGATGNQFLSPVSAFRVLTITAMNVLDVRSVSITRGGQVLSLRYEEPAGGETVLSAWHIKSPIVRDANENLVQEKLLIPMCTLVASGVAADNPADISAYGFTGDSVEIGTATETVRFSVGKADGIDYVMVEGKTAVYYMGSGMLSFMDVKAFDVLEKMTNLVSVDTVDTIDIKLPGISAAMQVRTEGKEKRYFVNDTPASEEAFEAMYLELIALSVDGEVTAKTETGGQSPAASIVFTLTDGSSTALAYYPYDDFNYAVYENGESTFYMKKTKLTELGEKLRTFVQNPQG